MDLLWAYLMEVLMGVLLDHYLVSMMARLKVDCLDTCLVHLYGHCLVLCLDCEMAIVLDHLKARVLDFYLVQWLACLKVIWLERLECVLVHLKEPNLEQLKAHVTEPMMGL